MIRRLVRNRPASSAPVATESAIFLINTLEQRRAQLIGRATVIAAADSALILAYLQFVVVGNDLTISVIIGLIGTLASVIAFYMSIRAVAGVSRRDGKRAGGRIRGHILSYQTVAALSPSDLATRLSAVNDAQWQDELAQQAVSLARLLTGRYVALKRSFRFTTISGVLLIPAIVARYWSHILDGSAKALESVAQLVAAAPWW